MTYDKKYWINVAMALQEFALLWSKGAEARALYELATDLETLRALAPRGDSKVSARLCAYQIMNKFLAGEAQ
jgi:hypothetical protein